MGRYNPYSEDQDPSQHDQQGGYHIKRTEAWVGVLHVHTQHGLEGHHTTNQDPGHYTHPYHITQQHRIQSIIAQHSTVPVSSIAREFSYPRRCLSETYMCVYTTVCNYMGMLIYPPVQPRYHHAQGGEQRAALYYPEGDQHQLQSTHTCIQIQIID